MNLQLLHRWMDDPGTLDAGSLPHLEGLVREFPYCQFARILLLLNLKKLEDHRFNRQVRLAAACTPDRSRLRYLMQMPGSMQKVRHPDAAMETEVAKQETIVQRPGQELEKIQELERMIRDSISEIEEKRNRLRLLLEEKKSMLADRKEWELSGEAQPDTRPLPTDELLDDFLKQQDRSEKGRFFNPVEKARKSLEDESSVTSETLARLLASQGKYQKAIKIYQQLLLNNPQKSSYFAAQIENLKKKINE